MKFWPVKLLAVWFVVAGVRVASQQPVAMASSAGDDQTIHYKGLGVVAPELVSMNGRPEPHDHCKKVDGEVTILFAVDRSGSAHLVYYLDTNDPRLYTIAQSIMQVDTFNPGTVDGVPAIVGVADRMKVETCKRENFIRLRSMPEQTLELVDPPEGALTRLPPSPESVTANPNVAGLAHVGKDPVKAPVIIRQAGPEFSDAARKAKYQGVCMISIIVDTNGLPQNPHVVRPLGMGLDQKAIEAVKQFRFKPAMKDGTPVPVMITVEVNFRLY